jgi:hypothetical protein
MQGGRPRLTAEKYACLDQPSERQIAGKDDYFRIEGDRPGIGLCKEFLLLLKRTAINFLNNPVFQVGVPMSTVITVLLISSIFHNIGQRKPAQPAPIEQDLAYID